MAVQPIVECPLYDRLEVVFSANFSLHYLFFFFFLSRNPQRYKHGLTLKSPNHFAKMGAHSKKGASARTEKKVNASSPPYFIISRVGLLTILDEADKGQQGCRHCTSTKFDLGALSFLY